MHISYTFPQYLMIHLHKSVVLPILMLSFSESCLSSQWLSFLKYFKGQLCDTCCRPSSNLFIQQLNFSSLSSLSFCISTILPFIIPVAVSYTMQSVKHSYIAAYTQEILNNRPWMLSSQKIFQFDIFLIISFTFLQWIVIFFSGAAPSSILITNLLFLYYAGLPCPRFLSLIFLQLLLLQLLHIISFLFFYTNNFFIEFSFVVLEEFILLILICFLFISVTFYLHWFFLL